MVERNRQQSGRKAAETNRQKDAKYYENIGSIGGAAVSGAKRAFSRVKGLASKAARARFLRHDQGTEYLVKSPSFKTQCADTREEARAIKRKFRFLGYEGHIIRIIYDETGFIIEEKEIW